MTIRKRLGAVFVFMGAFGAFTPAADAMCGLGACPLDLPAPEQDGVGLALTGQVAFAAFEFNIGAGHWYQFIARADYLGFEGVRVGALVPATTLLFDNQNRTGLGNVVAYAEWLPDMGTDTIFAVGMQLELPTGDRENGLADNHVEGMFYSRLQRAFAPRWYLVGQVGIRQSLKFSTDDVQTNSSALRSAHGANLFGDGEMNEFRVSGGIEQPAMAEQSASPVAMPVVVNPHEEFEIVYRGGVMTDLADGLVLPMLYLSGEQVLIGTGPRAFVYAGGRAIVDLAGSGLTTQGKGVNLTLSAEIPLTEDSRVEWRGEVGLSWRM